MSVARDFFSELGVPFSVGNVLEYALGLAVGVVRRIIAFDGNWVAVATLVSSDFH